MHAGSIFNSRNARHAVGKSGPTVLRVLILSALAGLLTTSLMAQTGNGILFGDLTVDESKAGDGNRLSYDIILYFMDGRMVARQKVANGGRYRFVGIRGGEYDIVVEIDNQEVARLRVNVGIVGTGSEVRRDIELEWRELARGTSGPRRQTISVADFYERSGTARSDFHKAQTALDNKKYAEAQQLLERIVTADGKDFQAWTELGTALLLQKKEDEAEKAYLRATEEKPDFFLALLNLGRLRSVKKNFAEAIDPLTRAVDANATSAEANFLLGEAYLQLKKGSKAVGYLNEAARLGRAEAHLRLAALYDLAKLKDRAVAEYEQFLQKKPDYQDRKKLEKYIADNKKP